MNTKQLLEGVLNGLLYGGCIVLISSIGYMRDEQNANRILQNAVKECVKTFIE